MACVLLMTGSETAGSAALAQPLLAGGHRVDLAASWRGGFGAASSQVHQLILIDRALPEIGGLALVRLLRACGVATPLLMLSASADADARLEALDAGADDQLTAPFSDAELLARVDALARPAPSRQEPTVLRVADLALDLQERTAVRAGRSIRLRPRDFDVLACLLRHHGRAVSHARLLRSIWGQNPPDPGVLDASINRIRARVDRGASAELIHVVPGVGYILVDAD